MPLQCRCPVCRDAVQIADEDLGGLCKCPMCGVSFDATVLPRAATSLEVSRDASLPAARRELAEADRGRVTALLVDKELKLRKLPLLGRGAPLPTSFGRRLRTSTAVAGVLLLACIASAVWGSLDPEGRGIPDLAAGYLILCGVLPGIILAVLFFPRLMQDLRLPGPGSRGDPIRGLKAFVLGLRQGRYEYAYECLLPPERDGRPRPSPQGLGGTAPGSAECSFASIEGFRDYWRPLLRPSELKGTSIAARSFLSVQRSEDVAEAICVLDVRKEDPGRALLGALVAHLIGFSVVPVSICRIEMHKLLRRVDDQWYLINGELASPEDGAFDEASRIAALSDAALAAELVTIRQKAGAGKD